MSSSDHMSMSAFSMLFGIKGRIARAQYWGWSLGMTAVLGSILALCAVGFSRLSDGSEGARTAFVLLSVPLYMLFLWSSISIAAKRCHDRNRSAFFLLAGLIPFIGGLILFADLGCLDGTQGPNRFGPSPKGIVGSETFDAFA